MFSFKYTKSCLILFKGCIVFHCTVVPCLCNKFSTEGFSGFFFSLIFCYYKKMTHCATARVVVHWTPRKSHWVLRVRAENSNMLRWNKNKTLVPEVLWQYPNTTFRLCKTLTLIFIYTLILIELTFSQAWKTRLLFQTYALIKGFRVPNLQIWGQNVFLRMVFPAEDIISTSY